MLEQTEAVKGFYFVLCLVSILSLVCNRHTQRHTHRHTRRHTVGPTVGPTAGPTAGHTAGPPVGPTDGHTVGILYSPHKPLLRHGDA